MIRAIFLQVLEHCPALCEQADSVSEPVDVVVIQPGGIHTTLPESNSDLCPDGDTAPQTDTPPPSESPSPPLTVAAAANPLSPDPPHNAAVSQTDSANTPPLSNSPIATPPATPPVQLHPNATPTDTPSRPQCIKVESSV